MAFAIIDFLLFILFCAGEVIIVSLVLWNVTGYLLWWVKGYPLLIDKLSFDYFGYAYGSDCVFGSP